MGCEFHFVHDLKDENAKIRHVILLAKNHTGYKNILLANKLANDNGIILFGKVIPRIDWKILRRCSEGVICTTACGGGILSRLINTRQYNEALRQAQLLKDIFGDNLAFEIQPHAMTRNASPYNDYEDQRLVNKKLVEFGDVLGVKIIAATDAHYVNKEQWEAHDALLSIGSGVPVRATARLKYTAHEFFMKSRDEVTSFLQRYFKERADEFCDNTLLFASMCESPEWIDPKFSNPSGKELPDFPVKDQEDYEHYRVWLAGQSSDVQELDEDVTYLRFWCKRGFDRRVPAGKEKEYRDRLIEELDVIEELGFASYMLIVADYIDFCKKSDIPMGEGRGSVGGCMVAFLLDIHNADPIKYGLIFSRFLNKFKTEFPDIDSDFASFGKERVTQYIIDKYGADYVAHVSNINTITPKVYARDIARAFQFGGDRKTAVELGTAIADAIPDDIKTVERALDRAPLFIEFAESKEYAPLKKFALDIGGLPRAWSTHAGGLIIGKRKLHKIVPLRKDKDGNVAVEYEKYRVEENGLVKMDILGLSTLDVVANTLKIIESTGQPVPTAHRDFDAYDKKAYDLISNGETLCVFQLGKSGGTIDLCRKVKPKTIEDIAIINSLARPSARDIREDFIKTKNGEKEVEIMHPTLERAFGGTFGFGLYEECLMYLAQDVAGWDLHEADRLRKLTKEKGRFPKKVKEYKRLFIKDAVENGVPEKMATRIWNEIVDKFQGYGFNKPHAIFYSMLGYQTAYLKAHYPVEFLTANLILEDNSNAKMSDKNISKIKREMRKRGVNIMPPDLNKSEKVYRIVDGNTLLTGFSSLKYMGKDAIPEILEKRPFKSFEDFLHRVEGRKVRITAVQALAASGCLDGFGRTRKEMFLYASDYKKKLQVWKKKRPYETFDYPWPEGTGEWSNAEKYAMETYYVGEGFCCGVDEAYPGFFTNWALNFSKLPEIYPEARQGDSRDRYFLSAQDGVVQGIVRDYFEFKVRNEKSKIFGETMAKLDIEDPYGGTISMTLFPSGLDNINERLRALTNGKAVLEPGIGIHCAASVNWYEGDVSLVFEDLKRATPIPPRPSDLKHRAVSMRITTPKKIKTKELDPDLFLEQVEDELIADGHSDISDI